MSFLVLAALVGGSLLVALAVAGVTAFILNQKKTD